MTLAPSVTRFWIARPWTVGLCILWRTSGGETCRGRWRNIRNIVGLVEALVVSTPNCLHVDALRMTIPTENHMPCVWPLCAMCGQWLIWVSLTLLILQHQLGFSSMCRIEMAAFWYSEDRCRFAYLRRRIFQVNPWLQESILSGLKELSIRSNRMQLIQNGVGLVPKVVCMHCVHALVVTHKLSLLESTSSVHLWTTLKFSNLDSAPSIRRW